MDATGENARALTSNAIEEFDLDISPDNSQVLFTRRRNERFEPYYPTTLFVVPASGGAPRPAATGFPLHVRSARPGRPTARTILAVGEHGRAQRVLPDRPSTRGARGS